MLICLCVDANMYHVIVTLFEHVFGHVCIHKSVIYVCTLCAFVRVCVCACVCVWTQDEYRRRLATAKKEGESKKASGCVVQ